MCTTQAFTVPATGNYLFRVAGAQGGTTVGNSVGGLGATVSAVASLQNNATVYIIVGRQGDSGGSYFANGVYRVGAGGGGLSAIYTIDPFTPSIVAGAVPTPS